MIKECVLINAVREWWHLLSWEAIKTNAVAVLSVVDVLIASTTSHVINYKNCIIIIKNVPCEECAQCGDKHFI